MSSGGSDGVNQYKVLPHLNVENRMLLHVHLKLLNSRSGSLGWHLLSVRYQGIRESYFTWGVVVELDELLELLIMLVASMGADSVVGLARVTAEWVEAEVVEKSSVISGMSSSSEKFM